MSLAVVIPARDVATVLPRQLRALEAQHVATPWEVIVVDNGSTDDTRSVAAQWRASLPLRVVDAPAKASICHARNVGTRSSSADVVAYCDADDVVAPGWADAMRRAAATHDVFGGRLDLAALNEPHVVAARGRFFDDGLFTGAGFLPFAIGANLGVRRTVFEALGGFDENLVLGADDVEFCWRAQLRGYSLGWAPDAVVQYQLRHRASDVFRQYFRYGKAEPYLYKQYASAGMPRGRTTRQFMRKCVRLAANLPHLRDGRAVGYAADAGHTLGRVAGSVNARTRYL